MIGKVSPHGQRVTGLIYYLFGPGRKAEHTDPHIVAGWRHPAELEPPLREDGRRDFRHRFTAAEQAAIWEHAARTAAGAAEQIRNVTASDPEAAADAAWAAADTLHAAAAVLGSRVLRQAADSYDRAARAPYGRIPAPGQPGNNLRRAARLLSTPPSVADVSLAETTLLMRFAKLAEAIAELREAQRLAAQAAAARRAAEHLRAAVPGYVTPPSGRRTRVRASAERSRAEFPFPPGTFRPGTGSLGKADGQRGVRPAPSQRPSRPRGPTR